MATAIVMPRLGMTMETGTVTAWPKRVGDRVEKGEVVVVIETEKAEAEVEATAAGYLRHIGVTPGETVPSGTLLAVMTDTADEPFELDVVESSRSLAGRSSAPPAVATSGRASASSDDRSAVRTRARAVTPRARRLAKRLGVDLDALIAVPGGRIREQDVRDWATGRERSTRTRTGLALEVFTEGSGPPVALLPGFGTDSSLFEPQATKLADSHRVVLVNPRGVGRSDAPASDAYTVGDYAADTAAVLSELGAAPATVVGVSLGAAAAIEMALEHPKTVHSLVLLSPFVEASAKLLATIEAWQLLALQPAATAARALLPLLVGETLLADRSARERTARGLAGAIERTSPDALGRWAAGLRAWSGSRCDDLGNIRQPTVIVFGEDDQLTPPRPMPWTQIADARLETFPGCGHTLPLEAAERVTRLILEH